MAEIQTTDNKTALIDDNDLPLVQGHNFHTSKRASGEGIYVMTWDSKAKKPTTLMALLLGGSKMGHVKFINGNQLDFRRENLSTAASQIVIDNENSYMLVHRKGESFKCWIDAEDARLLLGLHCRWSINPGGYVFTGIDGKTVYIHRFLTKAQEGFEVDHADNNPLNNRRNNLTVVTPLVNAENRPSLIAEQALATKPDFLGENQKRRFSYIEKHGNDLHIELTQGQIAIVGIEDQELVAGKTWRAIWNPTGQKFYAATGPGTIYLHQVIMGTSGQGRSIRIDHIDNNGLNCRRGNLRITTATQNAQNRLVANRNNKLGERNILLLKPTNTLQVRVVSGKKILSATFPNTPEGMELARQKAVEFRTELGFLE